jgi:hypothetical protein
MRKQWRKQKKEHEAAQAHAARREHQHHQQPSYNEHTGSVRYDQHHRSQRSPSHSSSTFSRQSYSHDNHNNGLTGSPGLTSSSMIGSSTTGNSNGGLRYTQPPLLRASSDDRPNYTLGLNIEQPRPRADLLGGPASWHGNSSRGNGGANLHEYMAVAGTMSPSAFTGNLSSERGSSGANYHLAVARSMSPSAAGSRLPPNSTLLTPLSGYGGSSVGGHGGYEGGFDYFDGTVRPGSSGHQSADGHSAGEEY